MIKIKKWFFERKQGKIRNTLWDKVEKDCSYHRNEYYKVEIPVGVMKYFHLYMTPDRKINTPYGIFPVKLI